MHKKDLEKDTLYAMYTGSGNPRYMSLHSRRRIGLDFDETLCVQLKEINTGSPLRPIVVTVQEVPDHYSEPQGAFMHQFRGVASDSEIVLPDAKRLVATWVDFKPAFDEWLEEKRKEEAAEKEMEDIELRIETKLKKLKLGDWYDSAPYVHGNREKQVKSYKRPDQRLDVLIAAVENSDGGNP